MIDPSKCTNFNRTRAELEEFLLFAIVVAGKKATTQAAALERFLNRRLKIHPSWYQMEPFRYLGLLRGIGNLESCVREARLGQYTRITAAFSTIAQCFVTPNPTNYFIFVKRSKEEAVLDGLADQMPPMVNIGQALRNLHTVQPHQLEAIPGIGPKTARYFILHTQKDAQVAALDRHILKFLRAQGVARVPENTPSGTEYARLEGEYLRICNELRVNPAEFDLAIWRHYSEGYELEAA